MPCCVMKLPDQVKFLQDKELRELLEEVNGRVGRQIYYIDTNMRPKPKKLFKKREYGPHYELLVDYGSEWDMQVLLGAGATKETVMAWLYGFLVAMDENKKKEPLKSRNGEKL